MKIHLNPLDPASVQDAIKQVRDYRNKLDSKVKEFQEAVALEIGSLAETGFNGAGYDDVLMEGTSVPNVTVEVQEREDKSIVVALGTEAVFAEFGAGVYYNGPAGSSPHPWGQQNLFLIGTYGKGYGARKVWGYYDPPDKRDKEHLKLTHGTPASMPMYHATQGHLVLYLHSGL